MEMYFKRMKDEWTGLVEQADPPIRAKAAEIAVAHAHYLSIEFYRIVGNDSNLLIVFYVQIMPDDFVMQLHRF